MIQKPVSGHALFNGALALLYGRDVAVHRDLYGVTTAATGTW